ncbi:DNA-binding protein [Mesorhizobium sp. M0306]|uniref:DNA-binding protein n=1 Tax=Mesorhizobium sp. M0306 TaxID=2956932 RepID=UPI00333D6CA3
MNTVGKHRWTVPEDTLTLVRELARLMPDRQIARLLNRAGKPTGRGNGWTQARICSFRSHHGIAVHRASEWAERGKITLEAAAQIMDVSVMTALRMARLGIIKGRQVCYGAPWAFKTADIPAYRTRNAPQRPLTADPAQRALIFNDIESEHYDGWLLGHRSLATTTLYAQVSTAVIGRTASPFDQLHMEITPSG